MELKFQKRHVERPKNCILIICFLKRSSLFWTSQRSLQVRENSITRIQGLSHVQKLRFYHGHHFKQSTQTWYHFNRPNNQGKWPPVTFKSITYIYVASDFGPTDFFATVKKMLCVFWSGFCCSHNSCFVIRLSIL